MLCILKGGQVTFEERERNKRAAELLTVALLFKQEMTKEARAQMFANVSDFNVCVQVRFTRDSPLETVTPLIIAVYANNRSAVRKILKRKEPVETDPNFAESLFGFTPFHYTLSFLYLAGGALPTIDLLLADRRVLIGKTNKIGTTPLMTAAEKGNAIYVEKLLRLGADQFATDQRGLTALEYSFISSIRPNPAIPLLSPPEELEEESEGELERQPEYDYTEIETEEERDDSISWI